MPVEELREQLKLRSKQLQHKSARLEQVETDLDAALEKANIDRLTTTLETQSKITRLEEELEGYRSYMDGVLLEGKGATMEAAMLQRSFTQTVKGGGWWAELPPLVDGRRLALHLPLPPRRHEPGQRGAL